MSERTIYRPGAATVPLRTEWVSLPGGDLCVRELTVAESTQILEKSERPGIDPRGGHNQGRLRVFQAMMSCYDGEGESAKRIFSEADLLDLYKMPLSQFDLLINAINRVNGSGAEEGERLKDFTKATGAPNPSA